MKKSKKPLIVQNDPDDMNVQRAEWAAEALRNFASHTGCDYGEEALHDLFANLMHWADREGVDWAKVLSASVITHQEEAGFPEQATHEKRNEQAAV